ncbi:MAG: hypothetical protein NTV79_00945, partial [Candidatus Aureabacteria bacterium]|nr:hypothetical protein [Candidatus Auribacterota bacterium]
MSKSSLALRLSLLIVPLTLASLLLADVLKSPPPVIVRVDPSRAMGGDGSSWEEAYSDLQKALDGSSSGAEVWCAQGDLGEVKITKIVKIYGGFDGTENSVEQRDWVSNRSILRSLSVTAPASLDGFAFIHKGGGAAFVNVEDAILRNCLFDRCSSARGIIVFENCSAPSLINCYITRSTAGKKSPAPLIAFKDCRDVEISHCTIADNVLKSGKQAILRFSDSAGDVFNTILLNPGFPEIAVEGESDLAVYSSDIEGGYPGEGNISFDPLFAKDYHLSFGSPCRDRGCPEGAPEEDWDNDER